MSWDPLLTAGARLAEQFAVRALVAIVAALIAWRLALWAQRSLERGSVERGVDPNARLLSVRLLHGATLVVGGLLILQILGVELTVVLATFGVAGLALSLAVQDILKSFFAGIYLLFERPFVIGEEIQVKDHVGKVETIGFRSTTVRTAENVLVRIPNSLLFTEPISNRSQRTTPAERPADD